MSGLIDRDRYKDNIFDQIDELKRRLDILEKYPTGQVSADKNIFSLPGGDGGGLMPLFKSPIDYSSVSTITGWSSFTSKVVQFQQVGNLMFVHWELEGTSNAGSASVTLPRNAHNGMIWQDWGAGVWQDSGTPYTDGAYIISAGTGLLQLYINSLGLLGWTASGAKRCYGNAWYILDYA